MKTLVLAAALLSLATGCAAAPPRAAPPEARGKDMFVLRAGSARVHARIGAGEVVGPEVMLARDVGAEGAQLRGLAFGKPVLLTVRDGKVAGVVGSRPFKLDVSRDGGALQAAGLVGGNMSTLRFADEGARILIGMCSYELTAIDGGEYAGRKSCGGGRQLVRVYVPDTLAEWSAAEQAAVLAVLIHRQQG
jgi:hypothetical protein